MAEFRWTEKPQVAHGLLNHPVTARVNNPTQKGTELWFVSSSQKIRVSQSSVVIGQKRARCHGDVVETPLFGWS